MRAAVHMPVDALVELDQRPLVVLAGCLLELVEECGCFVSFSGRRTLGGEPTRERFERAAHLGQRSQIPDIDARDEDSLARVDIHQALLRQPPQRLAHRRATKAEPRHQLGLAYERAWLELQRDDQVTEPEVRLIAERPGVGSLGLMKP